MYKIIVISVVRENVAARERQGVWKGGHNKSVSSQVGLKEGEREINREKEGERDRKREKEKKREKEGKRGGEREKDNLRLSERTFFAGTFSRMPSAPWVVIRQMYSISRCSDQPHTTMSLI